MTAQRDCTARLHSMTGNLLIYIAIERVRSAPLLFAGLVHTPTVNRRREFCHFADSPFPSTLKRLREGRGRGESSRTTVSPMATRTVTAPQSINEASTPD